MYHLSRVHTTASNVFSAYASLAASLMLFRSLVNDVMPEPMKCYIYSVLDRLFCNVRNPISNRVTMLVDEMNGMSRNEIYDAAEIYLRPIIDPNSERFVASKNQKQKSITLSMEKNREIVDLYNGVEIKWQFVLIEGNDRDGPYREDKRHYEVSFHKKHKDFALNDYLPYVLEKAKEIKMNQRAVKLYTKGCRGYGYDDEEDGGYGGWGSINLDHPVTFDKLAMDPELKKAIIDDLERFLRRKEFYRRVGKAWKRGYLLYGPPGTGKSSLVAAMANYLRFDVYDLELSSLYSDMELRSTLTSIANRSIIVIEDIDCSTTQDRETMQESSNSKLTLSGILNFMDGLWSSCGDERIIIFTTNYKEKLDPALLRPGRMDMHIHMSYCTFAGLKVLASNYLGIDEDHHLFPEIQNLMEKVKITPAEIAEQLLKYEDADLALGGLIDLLKETKAEQERETETGNIKSETASKSSENDVKEKGKTDGEKDQEREEGGKV